MKIFEIIGATNPFYHGTARANLVFAPNAIAYFSRHYRDAVLHALADSEHEGGTPRVIKVALDIQNPTRMTERNMQDLQQYPKMVANLRRLGHDAVLAREHDNEIAILNPSKIRVLRIINVAPAPAQVVAA